MAQDKLITGWTTVSKPGATLEVKVLHLSEEGRRLLSANVSHIPAATASHPRAQTTPSRLRRVLGSLLR